MSRLARAVIARPDVSLRAALRVWQRNATVHRKTYHLNVVPNFVEPVLYLIAMGFGLGTYVAGIEGKSYLQFLAPGLLASQAAMGASFEATYNAYWKLHYAKTYDAITATPTSPADVALGELLWATTRGTGYGVTFLIVAALFGAVATPAAALSILALPFVAAAFAVTGLTFTAVCPNVELLNYYSGIYLTPLFFFSGIFFPLEALPGWVRAAAAWTPLYHGVRACRGLVEGGSGLEVLASVLWLGALTVLGGWVAMGLFEWRLRR